MNYMSSVDGKSGNINILHFELHFTHFAKKNNGKVLCFLEEAFKSITRLTVQWG